MSLFSLCLILNDNENMRCRKMMCVEAKNEVDGGIVKYGIGVWIDLQGGHGRIIIGQAWQLTYRGQKLM